MVKIQPFPYSIPRMLPWLFKKKIIQPLQSASRTNLLVRLYIYLSTVNPKAIPRKVAMAIPKMPARIPGTTKELHPLAVAIPQAVVGPPTFALDAISSNLRSKRKSFPKPSITARWTAIWTRANKKILGAVLITFHMLPLAPTTVKNTCYPQQERNRTSHFKHGKFTTKIISIWQISALLTHPGNWNINWSCKAEN